LEVIVFPESLSFNIKNWSPEQVAQDEATILSPAQAMNEQTAKLSIALFVFETWKTGQAIQFSHTSHPFEDPAVEYFPRAHMRKPVAPLIMPDGTPESAEHNPVADPTMPVQLLPEATAS